MHPINTEAIISKFRRYPIYAIVSCSVILFLVTIWPLYKDASNTYFKTVMMVRDTSGLFIDEYVTHLESIAMQISNRTGAKALLQDYLAGKKTVTEITPSLAPILRSGLKSNAKILSIARQARTGKVITQVGAEIPQSYWPKKDINHKIKIEGPFKKKDQVFVIISSPIFDENKSYLGRDLVLVDITKLQFDINEKVNYKAGNSLIFFSENNVTKIFPLLHKKFRDHIIEMKPEIDKLITPEFYKSGQGFIKKKILSDDVIIAYKAVSDAKIIVAVIVEDSSLLGSLKIVIKDDILVVILFILVLVLIFNRITGPLSGRLILHEHELQDAIKKANKDLEEKNEKLTLLTLEDELTKVHNRRAFSTRLKDEIIRGERYKRQFALFFIDINSFKEINDTYGHDAGDTLLIQFCSNVSQTLRKSDFFARIGGDEFVVLSPETWEENQVKNIIKKIKVAASEPVQLEDIAISYGVSTGYAIYPDNGEDEKALINYSDRMMYEIKRKRKKI